MVKRTRTITAKKKRETISKVCKGCNKKKRLWRSKIYCTSCYRKWYRVTNRNRDEKILEYIKENYKEIYDNILDTL